MMRKEVDPRLQGSVFNFIASPSSPADSLRRIAQENRIQLPTGLIDYIDGHLQRFNPTTSWVGCVTQRASGPVLTLKDRYIPSACERKANKIPRQLVNNDQYIPGAIEAFTPAIGLLPADHQTFQDGRFLTVEASINGAIVLQEQGSKLMQATAAEFRNRMGVTQSVLLPDTNNKAEKRLSVTSANNITYTLYDEVTLNVGKNEHRLLDHLEIMHAVSMFDAFSPTIFGALHPGNRIYTHVMAGRTEYWLALVQGMSPSERFVVVEGENLLPLITHDLPHPKNAPAHRAMPQRLSSLAQNGYSFTDLLDGLTSVEITIPSCRDAIGS